MAISTSYAAYLAGAVSRELNNLALRNYRERNSDLKRADRERITAQTPAPVTNPPPSIPLTRPTQETTANFMQFTNREAVLARSQIFGIPPIDQFRGPCFYYIN